MDPANARRVYVISDLHLGGVYSEKPGGRGFRINTQVPQLAGFVSSLAAQPREANIELIINGDMIDFLAEREAEPPYWKPFTLNPAAACDKLAAIVARDRVFFDSLRALLDAGHRLTILTGNHDIELELPQVRRKLRQLIGVRTGHDYEFIYSGEAYIVGDALIEHGHRYDDWNKVGHNELREVSCMMSRGQKVDLNLFQAPPGSKMVSSVINPIKEDYKFIDLLKPENDALVLLLLALEPGYRALLASVAKLALEARQQSKMESASRPAIGTNISAMGALPSMLDRQALMHALQGQSVPDAGHGDLDDEAALQQIIQQHLGSAAGNFGAAVRVGTNISTGETVNRVLGFAHLLFATDNADIGARLPDLITALRAVQPDRSFDPGYETQKQYSDAAAELLGNGFRYVIFGHTHLAKKIELKPGCWYLNSGTWADMMKLPSEIQTGSPEEAQATLEPFLQDLARGYLTQWVVHRPTYIELDLDASDRVIAADLHHYEPAAAVAGA